MNTTRIYQNYINKKNMYQNLYNIIQEKIQTQHKLADLEKNIKENLCFNSFISFGLN